MYNLYTNVMQYYVISYGYYQLNAYLIHHKSKVNVSNWTN